MTSTFAPFGIKVIGRKRAANYTGGQNTYPIANAHNTNIFPGDPVKRVPGSDAIALSSASTDYSIGLFVGCYYIDSNKRPVWSQYFPAGTSSAGAIDGDNRPQAMVDDDPNARMIVQADATVSAGDVGKNFSCSLGGNTTLGQSTGHLLVASLTSATNFFRLDRIYKAPGNALADAFPIVEATWVQHQDLKVSSS